MTYNFKNYAIKCDEWSQMEELAKMAEKQGYRNLEMTEDEFHKGYMYFVIMPDFNAYTNVDTATSTETITTFTAFITSHPDYRVEGC
jgi:hypothetical protein